MQDVIDELRLYVTGWLNYFGISHSYKAVLELGDWVRCVFTTGSNGSSPAHVAAI
ncbi:MAG TPA: group II intron maturase-specific domain-containing protein [Terrimicrobiaceae bacterium]